MAEETAGAETPEAEVAQTDATVETSEATAEQPTTEADNSESAPDEAAAPRKKPGVHNRIDELTRQKHEALREADYWRNKAKEASAADLDALDYDDQLVAKVRIAERQERAETAQENADKAVFQQFSALEADARNKWSDYDAVTRSPTVPITQELADLIVDSEYGPAVAYHLGKNIAEASRIAQMTGKQLAREVGRLEAKLMAPKPLPKQPSAPVQPVGGASSGGSLDPAKMSMAEYAAARKAGKI